MRREPAPGAWVTQPLGGRWSNAGKSSYPWGGAANALPAPVTS